MNYRHSPPPTPYGAYGDIPLSSAVYGGIARRCVDPPPSADHLPGMWQAGFLVVPSMPIIPSFLMDCSTLLTFTLFLSCCQDQGIDHYLMQFKLICLV